MGTRPRDRRRPHPAGTLTRQVLVLPDPRLRLPARKIRVPDAGVRHLAEEMLVAVRTARGPGLAAPQVGESLAFAIVDVEGRLRQLANLVLVRAAGTQDGWEGCLSVPGRVPRVARAAQVAVRAQDLGGNRIRVRRSGLEARALLYELDHLAGRLYVDLVPADAMVSVEAEPPSS